MPSNGFQAYDGADGGAGSTLCGINLGCGGKGGRTVYVNTGTIGSGLTSGQAYGAGGGAGGGGCNTSGSPNYSGAAGAPGIIQVTQYILS
jgi:hypothetical protein